MPRILAILLLALLTGTASLPLAGDTLLPAALADDDDDYGDDDDDDDGGYRWGGSDDDDDDDDDDDRFRPRRPRAVVPLPPPPRAVLMEIVVGQLTDDDLARITGAGFVIVDSAQLTAFGGVIARLRPPAGVSIDVVRAQILAIVPTAVVEPNHLYRPVEMPCSIQDCPAFAMVGWAVPPDRCNLQTTIGMIDTRINTEHPALVGQSIEVLTVMSEDDRESTAVHGTATAALLVGDGDSRTPGLLPQARLIAVEAFHRDGAGDVADVFKIVRAIDALGARDIGVVNLGFAGPANALLERVVSRTAESGMILVAAAGNEGPRAPPAYPAAYDAVIAVTAVDKAGRVYRQAGQGDHITFAAPGVRLWTAASVSGGRFRSGTSYAAPFVTAAVAAALAGGEQSTGDVIERLAAQTIDLGATGRDPVFGWGMVRGTC